MTSIAAQTAAHRIGEVVVMENGGSRATEEICKEFPQLPVRYVFRDPPITDFNLKTQLGEPRFRYAAMLCDDDWWTDFHLDRGLACLEQHPGASAFYCNGYTISADNGPINGLINCFVPWFANDGAAPGDLRTIEFKDVLVASLFATGFHLSSLVCVSAAIPPCLPAFDDANPYDVDRTLSVELSRQGGILFHDTPGVFIRVHPGQDGNATVASGKAAYWFPKNTRRLLALAKDSGIDVRRELAERIARLGLTLEQIMPRTHPGATDLLFDEKLLPDELAAKFGQIFRSQPAAPVSPKRKRLFGFLRRKKKTDGT